MSTGMKIAFFGSSLVSAYWNGAATYYRGIIRALAARGHRVTFYEPDAYDRQKHRDIDPPDWADVVVYPGDDDDAAFAMVERAKSADLVVKASGVGVYDVLLERAVLDLKSSRTLVAFWDVDAPATLDRIAGEPADPFRALVPQYDVVFTYGGGEPVRQAYLRFGARACVPIYNALDPDTHHPVPPEPRFEGALGFLGNRLPDREARVEEFFLRAAAKTPDKTFLLGGNGWHDKAMPANVKYLGHVFTKDHNAFNCTPLAVLNVNRESMARYGFSPATRVFEAAGAGACLVTDAFVGLELFLEPDRDVLRNVVAVPRHEHTYAHRAVQVEEVLSGLARKSARTGGAGVEVAP